MKQTRNHYSDEFKQQVLDDYFQSGMTAYACAKKWNILRSTFTKWVIECRSQENSVTLRHQKSHNSMDAKDQALENLRIENERLRREVEYQKLKVAGYERLLEIVKLEDGIDLLKKDGAKQ